MALQMCSLQMATPTTIPRIVPRVKPGPYPRPDDAPLIVTHLRNGGREPPRPDAVGAHPHELLFSGLIGVVEPEGL